MHQFSVFLFLFCFLGTFLRVFLQIFHHHRWCKRLRFHPKGSLMTENKLQRKFFSFFRMLKIYFQDVSGEGKRFCFGKKLTSRRWIWLWMDAGQGDGFVLRQKITALERKFDLRHSDRRFRVELLTVELKLFGHASPVLGVEVVVSAPLDGTALVVMRISRHSHYPHFLLHMISPITLITKNVNKLKQVFN